MSSIASNPSYHSGADPGTPRRSQRLAGLLRNKQAAQVALEIPRADGSFIERMGLQMEHLVFLMIAMVSVCLVFYCFSLIPADWAWRNLCLGIIGLLAGVALVIDNLALVSVFCKA
jgi:hypothetical protein